MYCDRNQGDLFAVKLPNVTDNGGRRSGLDRRQYACRLHIPERRSGQDRRNGEDRRRRRRC